MDLFSFWLRSTSLLSVALTLTSCNNALENTTARSSNRPIQLSVLASQLASDTSKKQQNKQHFVTCTVYQVIPRQFEDRRVTPMPVLLVSDSMTKDTVHSHDYDYIKCYCKKSEDISSLSAGQQVTLSGRVRWLTATDKNEDVFELTDCSIIQRAPNNVSRIPDSLIKRIPETVLEYIEWHKSNEQSLAQYRLMITQNNDARYSIANFNQLDLSDGHLPKDQVEAMQKLIINELTLLPRTGITDLVAEDISKLNYCEKLTIEAGTLTEKGLAKILSIPGLHALKINGPNSLHANDFKHLERAPGLLSLSIDSSGMRFKNFNHAGGDLLKHLNYVKKLRFLNLSGPQIIDKDLDVLERLPYLAKISLIHTGIEGSGLKSLANPKQLAHLTLWGKSIDDSLSEALPKMNNLFSLSLNFTSVTSDVFLSLESHLNLKQLFIINGLVDGSVGKKIKDMRNLELLRLNYCPIADDFELHQENVPSLKEIDLSNTKIGSSTLKSLAKIHSLRIIRASKTQIDDEAIEYYVSNTQEGNSIQVITLDGTKVTANGIRRLATIQTIDKIYIDYELSIPDDLQNILGNRLKYK